MTDTWKGRLEELGRLLGWPSCENGHGLTPDNTTDDGDCVTCGAWMVMQDEPADEWLDWAQVHQAIQGLPLVRPLTRHEVLCAIETVRRRQECPRTEACDWLSDNTYIDNLPADRGDFLYHRWAPRRGLRPVTTVEAMQLDFHIATSGDDNGGALAA